MGFWGMFLVLVFLEKSWGQDQIYVSPAPTVFRVGVPENISVEAHGYTDALEATISVKSYPNEDISYTSGSVNLSPENNFQNYTILTIQAEQLSEGQNSYSYVYLEVMSKDFSKSEKVPITYGNDSLLIHVDWPVYTPREPVKVAVYSLEDGLAPVTRETVLTFIDPEGSEVGIVEGNNQTGVASFPDFNIPSNPVQGRWTVKAKYKDDASTTGTTHFEVEEHDKAYKITLTPASAQAHRAEEQDEAHDVSVQPASSLEQEIEEKASKYKHPILKKCCYDGAIYSHHETCEERAARVKIGPRCVKAFTECCGLNTLKHFHLSRHHHQR